jgi:hypothetical protein
MTTAEILESHPAASPRVVAPRTAPAGLVALLGLDRLQARASLVCRWQRDPKDRLAGWWEADIASALLL